MRVVPEQIAARLPAAAALFAERGVHSAKIEDVATVTGVPKATLYYYFSGKEDILAFLFENTLRQVAEAVETASRSGGTAADRLLGVIHAQLLVMSEQPAACRALVGELGRAGRMPVIAEAIRTAYHAPVAALLAEGAADRSLRPVSDVDATALMIFGAVTVTGLAPLVAGDVIAVDSVARSIADVVLEGLRPR